MRIKIINKLTREEEELDVISVQDNTITIQAGKGILVNQLPSYEYDIVVIDEEYKIAEQKEEIL